MLLLLPCIWTDSTVGAFSRGRGLFLPIWLLLITIALLLANIKIKYQYILIKTNALHAESPVIFSCYFNRNACAAWRNPIPALASHLRCCREFHLWQCSMQGKRLQQRLPQLDMSFRLSPSEMRCVALRYIFVCLSVWSWVWRILDRCYGTPK